MADARFVVRDGATSILQPSGWPNGCPAHRPSRRTSSRVQPESARAINPTRTAGREFATPLATSMPARTPTSRRRYANVDDVHMPVQSDAPGSSNPFLRATNVAVYFGSHACSQRTAGVAIHAGGKIDSEHARRGLVDFLNHADIRLADSAPQARAEQRIDHPVGLGQFGGQFAGSIRAVENSRAACPARSMTRQLMAASPVSSSGLQKSSTLTG